MELSTFIALASLVAGAVTVITGVTVMRLPSGWLARMHPQLDPEKYPREHQILEFIAGPFLIVFGVAVSSRGIALVVNWVSDLL